MEPGERSQQNREQMVGPLLPKPPMETDNQRLRFQPIPPPEPPHPLTDIVEVAECKRRACNLYLAHGWRLLAVEHSTLWIDGVPKRFRALPKPDGDAGEEAGSVAATREPGPTTEGFFTRVPLYVLGRPRGVEPFHPPTYAERQAESEPEPTP